MHLVPETKLTDKIDFQFIYQNLNEEQVPTVTYRVIQ